MKLYLIFFVVYMVKAGPLKPFEPSEVYTRSLVADEDRPDQIRLYWKLLQNDEIQFELHAKTTGWIGFGLSPNGGMPGSDIVIGWVSNGKANLKDCYASAKAKPLADREQNVDLIEGAETNGYTILKFKRKLLSCDEQNDKDIKMGTQYLIFAWNNDDPVTGNDDWKYHDQNRFSRVEMLLNFQDQSIAQQSALPSDTFTYDMKFNVRVPKQDTYYYCQVFPLPEFTKPTHLIQFEMLINPKNKMYVHHLLAYECADPYENTAPYSQECGAKPPGSLEVATYCMTKLIVAWGIGGQYNYSFPRQAGYRLSPRAKSRYLFLEMHYDNPKLKDDIVDDSGLRLYFTEQLRQHDLGVLTLGGEGTYISLQIPPKSNDWSFTSICYPECTQRFFPADGIYAVSALLHTHLSGRSVKTTLVRNGVAIKELFNNPNYDFNYQFLMDIEPTKLQKGDSLITQCRYNTNDRDKFTFFGFSTYDEMCFDFMYYYPQIPNFDNCISITPGNVLTDFYKSLAKDNLMPPFPVLEQEGANIYALGEEIMKFLLTNVTMSAQLTKRFEAFFASSYDKNIFCGSPIDPEGFIYKENVKHYTPIRNDIVDPKKCSSTASTVLISKFNLLILILCLIFKN